MIVSYITKQEISPNEAIQGKDIKYNIFSLIKSEHLDFSENDYVSIDELNKYRRYYLTTLIFQEKGELATIDADVVNAIKNNSILSETIRDEKEANLTIGQKIADKIAYFGGSWTFIISFFSFLALWILWNIYAITSPAFDPYPFILLNLILSCLASIQAPIIMMSQNRQEQKDRQRGEQDYKINLKAELEIQLLNEKIDHLIIHQNKRLLEIQELQTDYLEDIIKQIKSK